MKVAIHQPQYWPWLPYLLKIAESDLFIVLDSVAFQKNGVQNRNQIKTAQGAQWLTVPVKQNLGQLLLDVETDNTADWRRKHWSTIKQSYAKAPAFSKYAPELEALYAKPWPKLTDMNLEILKLLMGWLGIKTKVLRSSAMKSEGKASELILNLCREANATTYVSGVGGKNYLDENAFKTAGIVIDFRPPAAAEPYPQLHSQAGFIKDLSALDLILNCGPTWADHIKDPSLK